MIFFLFFCSFQALNIEYRYLDPLYQSMWRDYVKLGFLHEITNKNKFQLWIRVSNKFNSHDMIFFFCSFHAFNIEYRYLDPLYQINVARLCELGFLHEITNKNKFQLWIRVSNKFNSHDMNFRFFSALSRHLTLNIGIWIHCTKSMLRDYVKLGFFTRDYS